MKWPRDNQADLIRFYGEPGPEVERQLVAVVPPFRMTYEGKAVRSIRFHAKAAPALRSALSKVWDYYDHDQAKLDLFGISKFAGTYNPRKIRGSATKWSNHAYGAAIDINAEQNGFGAGHGTMPLPVVAAFKSEGFRWGGDYKGRTDPMHFEACDSGEPARNFEQWLDHYGCPRSAVAKPEALLTPTAPPAETKPVPAPADTPEADTKDAEVKEAETGVLAHLRRRWKAWTVGGIGGGLTIGGITLNAETIYAFGALLVIAFAVFLGWVYLVPPRGRIRKGL